MITGLLKVFVPVKVFVPLMRGMFAVSWESRTLPEKFRAFVAVVAVAALPEMLMPAVPAPMFAGFKPVNPAPEPVNAPVKFPLIIGVFNSSV